MRLVIPFGGVIKLSQRLLSPHENDYVFYSLHNKTKSKFTTIYFLNEYINEKAQHDDFAVFSEKSTFHGLKLKRGFFSSIPLKI